MVKSYVMSGLLNNNEVPANPAADASIAHLPEKFTTGTKLKKKKTALQTLCPSIPLTSM